MKTLLISVLILLLSTNIVNAFTLVAQPQEALIYSYKISGEYYSLATQVIINTPYLAFYHQPNLFDNGVYRRVASVDVVRMKLMNINANQPLLFRFYTYTSDVGYTLSTEYSLSTSACTETCELTIPLNTAIILSDNTIVSIGLYTEDDSYISDNTNGWYVYGDKVNKQYFNLPSFTNFLNVYTLITDAYNNPVNNVYIGYSINYLNYKLYGVYLFPSTPLQPTPPAGGSPLPCIDCNGDLPGLDSGGSGFTPDWTNLTYCPTCLGNETYNTTGIITSSNGFCGTILTFGYGSTEGCKSADFIDWLYDYSNIMFYISLILLIYKIYILSNRGN